MYSYIRKFKHQVDCTPQNTIIKTNLVYLAFLKEYEWDN